MFSAQNHFSFLPMLYSLMQREKRIMTMELQCADTCGEQPEVIVEGFPKE
ncbi:MAG: hypothetical protein ABR936_10500 [Bacteroidota bacterium]|jgi:hypothetical protein